MGALLGRLLATAKRVRGCDADVCDGCWLAPGECQQLAGFEQKAIQGQCIAEKRPLHVKALAFLSNWLAMFLDPVYAV